MSIIASALTYMHLEVAKCFLEKGYIYNTPQKIFAIKKAHP